MASFVTKNVSAAVGLQTKWAESPTEAESRQAANFAEIEEKLGKRFNKSDMNLIDKATSLLGVKNPFGKAAKPGEHEIWLLNNTAYRPVNEQTGTQEPWQAEFVACFFHLGRKDITSYVSNIADIIGLDGKAGEDIEACKRIEERVRPFVRAIGPARTVEISIPCPNKSGSPHKRLLGPSDGNGISSQLLLTGGADDADGSSVQCRSEGNKFPDLHNTCHFAGPEGWAIISDIDDTIKITQTPNPIGTLRTTFADLPKTTAGMPEFYKIMDEQFNKPAWFYLSASPYNLYPFINQFISDNYKPGTVILRDSSWMYFAGLLQSFTEGVQAYKTDRMEKIHRWLPKRKMICIGDSTQSDPESYAQIFKQYPGWIKAIYIRKVVDAPFMEKKNTDERFKNAFKDVPKHIWKVFVTPDELADHVKHLAGQAHMGIVGALQGYFCPHEQSIKKAAKEETKSPPATPQPTT